MTRRRRVYMRKQWTAWRRNWKSHPDFITITCNDFWPKGKRYGARKYVQGRG